MYQRKNQVQELKICIIDCLGASLSFLLAGLIRFQSLTVFWQATDFEPALLGILLIHSIVFYVIRVYEGIYRRGPWREFMKTLKYNVVLIMGITLYSFCTKNMMEYSRATLLFFAIINQFVIFALHRIIYHYSALVHKRSDSINRILLIADRESAETVVRSLNGNSGVDGRVTAVALMDAFLEGKTIENVPVVANRNNVLEYVVREVVDEVFIHVADLKREEQYYKHLILELEKMGIVVNVNVEIFNLGSEGTKRIYQLGDYYVAAFVTRLYDYRLMLVKRVIDIIGAVVGLFITLILTIFVAPAIKLESKGPLFFKQIRVGKNGRPFTFYKFRSMYAGAEEQKLALMEQNEMEGNMFKIENDPRITKVGRFIRRTSIDEFPQFWNVLKGDMSLVGTRPPTIDEYEHYEGWQKRRISFRPGITGLWQISGRSNIKSFDEVVKLDLEYIDNWSLGLDFKILAKTVIAVFSGIGAR